MRWVRVKERALLQLWVAWACKAKWACMCLRRAMPDGCLGWPLLQGGAGVFRSFLTSRLPLSAVQITTGYILLDGPYELQQGVVSGGRARAGHSSAVVPGDCSLRGSSGLGLNDLLPVSLAHARAAGHPWRHARVCQRNITRQGAGTAGWNFS